MTNVNIKGLDELIDELNNIEKNAHQLAKDGIKVPANATEEEIQQIILDKVFKQ